MRVAAQVFYFYDKGQAPPVVVEVEDSRWFPLKRHARVELRALEPGGFVAARLVALTTSVVPLQGISAALQLGSVYPASNARVELRSLPLQALIGKLTAFTSSLVQLAALTSLVQFGKVIVGASSAALLGTLETRASLRALEVHIGPDQVQQEEDELIEVLFFSDLL